VSLLNRGSSPSDDLLLAKQEFEALQQAADERLQRMQMYRDENAAPRSRQLELNNNSTDYGRKPRADGQPKRHNIPLPLGKALTVKHAYRIAGQLPDVVVDQRDESLEERHRSDTMEKIVWAVMRRSRAETAFASASWHGSEVGSACFDLYWDMRQQIPVFRAIDPMGVLEVQGVQDPHDFQRVYRMWDVPLVSVAAEYRDSTFRGQPVAVGNLKALNVDGGVEMVTIVQLCDRNHILRFALCGGAGIVGLYELEHNYGFAPYVVIPNIGPYDDVWGWADYEFVRAISGYMGTLFSREADVLKAVAAGAYQEDGTGKPGAEIARIITQGGVLSTKRDSKVQPIQAADMPTFAEAHADRGMQLIKMLGFAPDAAWGLPGSGSGTDRGLQLQPLLEYTAMKQLNWQSGLSRLFGMAFQMVEQKMVGEAKFRGSKPGSGRSKGKRQPFVLTIGPEAAPLQEAVDSPDAMSAAIVELPLTPKAIFDGDYEARFVWRNRVDPDDPQYVMSELNKFQQGVQSLETTLENLGVQAPESEMRRIEREAERFPWVNQGLVSLIMAQIRGNAQGTGGGALPDRAGALSGAMETMNSLGGGGQSGALNADAGAGALGADAVGIPGGGA